MIDLETMGTSNNSVILSIGAVFFDPYTSELGEEFSLPIDWKSCELYGLQADVDTIKWWLQQDKDAIKGILKQGVHLRDGLKEFSEFIRRFGKSSAKPWGNGATFDITILENAYKATHLSVPWKFYSVRDCRTVVDLASGIVNKDEVEFHGVKHNALDDAKHQAKYISKMVQALTQ